MSLTLTLPDGRTFPEYHGEPLSWSIALYLTPAEPPATEANDTIPDDAMPL